MNNSFVFYATFLDTVDKLNAAGQTDLANKVLRAIIDVGIYGEYTGGDVLVESYLPTIQLNIENATKRYQAASHGGSKGGRKTIYDKELIIELKKQGLTNTEVSKKAGNCSTKTVSRYWNEYLAEQAALGQNWDINETKEMSTPRQNMDKTGTFNFVHGHNQDTTETLNMSKEESDGQNLDKTETEIMSQVDYTKDFVF